MRMIQGSSVCSVESAKATSHLDHTDGQLKLYVPMDKQSREVCYLQELPKRVLEFLSLSDHAAEMLIVRILGSRSLDSVDDILESAGILEMAGVSRPVGADCEIANIWDEIDATERQQQTVYPPERSTANDEQHRIIIDLTQSGSEVRNASAAHLTDRSLSLVPSSPEPLRVVSTTEVPIGDAMYAKLLDRLIGFGRRAYLPINGDASHCFCERTSNLDNFNCMDHHVEYPSIFTSTSQDRQRKVGAAGELFVSPRQAYLHLHVHIWTNDSTPYTAAYKQLLLFTTNVTPGIRTSPQPRPYWFQRCELEEHDTQRSPRLRQILRSGPMDWSRDVRLRVP